MTKRLDIQALRGVAVLLVVFYHAGAALVPAGYLGVDVFFVISGFLITSVIAAGITAGRFSFAEFYYRRAKRLLPAAYVVTLATIVLAPFFISAGAFEEMKAQVIGAVTFTANFVLMRQSGYFDGAAESKPFLHFWSLALEEQYYLFMPLLLTLVGRRGWVPVVALLSAISLAASFWLAHRAPDLAFYLLPTRAWELGMGSLIALVPLTWMPSRVLSLARVPALIALLAVPAFPSGLPHPGVDALVVTVATTLIILGRTGTSFDTAAPVRMLAWFGDFSYSLYLVHWPVIVFTRAAWLGEPPSWALGCAVLVSVAVGYPLYRLVEEPFRRGFVERKVIIASGLAAVSVAMLLLPAAVSSALADDRDYAQVRRNNYGLDRACAFGGRFSFTGDLPPECRTRPDAKVLVWGDSYAMAWTSALMGPLADMGVEQATRGACDPLLGMARFAIAADNTYNRDYARGCIDIHRQILDYATGRAALEIVVLAGRFATILSRSNMMLVATGDGFVEQPTSVELAADGLAGLANGLRQAGKRVVFLAPPPADGSEIGDCLERQARRRITFVAELPCDLRRSDVDRVRGATLEMLDLASFRSGAAVVNMTDFFCDDERCRTAIDGTFLYRDSGHLSYEGGQLIGDRSDLADRIVSAAR